MINLIIGGAILGFLLMILTSRKFWRGLKYMSEAIANYTIGVVIELNPFAILEAKIDQGYKDRNTLYPPGRQAKGKVQRVDGQAAGQGKRAADERKKRWRSCNAKEAITASLISMPTMCCAAGSTSTM
jgi:hypothetical protein